MARWSQRESRRVFMNVYQPIQLREHPCRTVLVLQLVTHAIVKAPDFIFYALHTLAYLFLKQ